VCHDGFDDVWVTLFIDEELTDAAFPGAQIRQEFLKGLDAALGEGDEVGSSHRSRCCRRSN
jgi:hypothetical protein